MKIARGYIKTAFRVRDKRTERCYDCFIQEYPYNKKGETETRFNIGINGWGEWSFLMGLSEDEFNEIMEVVE